MIPKAKILRLNALHRLQEPQSNWFQNNLMTIKLAIKFKVFCRDLTLVAKYAFLQALSHLEIWLQAPGGILQPGGWDPLYGGPHSPVAVMRAVCRD